MQTVPGRARRAHRRSTHIGCVAKYPADVPTVSGSKPSWQFPDTSSADLVLRPRPTHPHLQEPRGQIAGGQVDILGHRRARPSAVCGLGAGRHPSPPPVQQPPGPNPPGRGPAQSWAPDLNGCGAACVADGSDNTMPGRSLDVVHQAPCMPLGSCSGRGHLHIRTLNMGSGRRPAPWMRQCKGARPHRARPALRITKPAQCGMQEQVAEIGGPRHSR